MRAFLRRAHRWPTSEMPEADQVIGAFNRDAGTGIDIAILFQIEQEISQVGTDRLQTALVFGAGIRANRCKGSRRSAELRRRGACQVGYGGAADLENSTVVLAVRPCR